MKVAPEAAVASRAKASGSSRATWHLLPIYYLLAAFGVFTVSMSLYLNHRIMIIYAGSVETNQKWAQRLAHYSELGQLAAAVNAPGNDVFNSHEVKAEAAKVRTALRRFNGRLEALREELRANVDTAQAAPLLEDFDAVEAAMGEMAEEAARIFFYFAENRPQIAGARMATMDRKYANVNAALARVREHINAIQKERFDEEIRAAAALQKFEYVTALLVLLMVGGVTTYGYKLARQVAADERERERYIASLRDAETRARSILDTAADGIVTFDEQGSIESVNPAAERIFGYAATELTGQHFKSLVLTAKPEEHDDGLASDPLARTAERLDHRALDYRGSRLANHLPSRPADLAWPDREVIGRRKDGTAFPLDLAVSEMHVGHRRMFTGILRDITERKRAEEQLSRSREELRALAAHLQSVREEERSRVSREIHDELGQVLTGLKWGLSWLASRLDNDRTPLREKLSALLELIDSTIQSVRRISTELRPGVLDDLGLLAAIEWQAQEFQARTGIDCRLTSDLADLEVERELSTAVFRICQETLTNVARHGGATRVDISLKADAGRLILAVKDDGKRITERETADATSVGLVGMRERALLLGGDFSIAGRPGEGTTVTVVVPYERPGGGNTARRE